MAREAGSRLKPFPCDHGNRLTAAVRLVEHHQSTELKRTGSPRKTDVLGLWSERLAVIMRQLRPIAGHVLVDALRKTMHLLGKDDAFSGAGSEEVRPDPGPTIAFFERLEGGCCDVCGGEGVGEY